MLDINSEAFADKVYGCWMGKNCGGTLGTPLEKIYGEPEPFDVWWYPKLQEGGIPNDDLEMQLVWLKALEEHGAAFNAQILAEYWLNHIGYNWDEYGWSRMGLRLGLLPPVSGNYNNWFIDCMGCPIRSEIFACVAPGLPRLAARLAYEDAITDHAGGESVYGELFNTAIESAAFVVSDLNELLNIGRSYVKDGTRTAATIDAARKAHAAGLDWKEARAKVMEAAPHYNAQYSPLNMGFQVVGLLYGSDFAQTLCIAVNCGYDTDCTGATVGSILGIIHGYKTLPQKWIAPLGDAIATNESWGGLRNCRVGDNPIPNDLHELTRRTVALAHRFSAGLAPDPTNFYADESIHDLWKRSPTCVPFRGGAVEVAIEYQGSPAVAPQSNKTLQTHLTNTAPVSLAARCRMQTPDGWEAPAEQEVQLPPRGTATLNWSIPIPQASRVQNSNRLYLQVSSPQRVAQPACPVVLIGARRMLISQPYKLDDPTIEKLITHAFEPEELLGHPLDQAARRGIWSLHQVDGNDLRLDGLLPAGHVIFVRAFFESAAARQVIVGLPNTGGVQSWVNGTQLHHLTRMPRFRPHGGKSEQNIELWLRAGFNELLIKFARSAADKATAFEAHLTLRDCDILNAGVVDVGWTRFPWDDAAASVAAVP